MCPFAGEGNREMCSYNTHSLSQFRMPHLFDLPLGIRPRTFHTQVIGVECLLPVVTFTSVCGNCYDHFRHCIPSCSRLRYDLQIRGETSGSVAYLLIFHIQCNLTMLDYLMERV